MNDFDFFKAKVLCALAKIQRLCLSVSTNSYRVYENDVVWIRDNSYDSIHPLAMIIVDQKILQDDSPLVAISRRLDCHPEAIKAFNSGLSNSVKVPEKIYSKFYEFGKALRQQHFKKKKYPY